MVSAHGRLPAVVLAVGLIGPLVVAVALATAALARSPLEADAQPAPVIAVVERAVRQDAESSSVTWVPADQVPVRSQSAGTVTAVDLVEGRAPTDGDLVLEVDGLPVFAFVAPTPPYRDIVVGVAGRDVLALQHFLAARGYDVTTDGTAGVSTGRAIAAFNSDHGRAGGEKWSSEALLWIPTTVGPPTAVEVRVGDVIAPETEVYLAPEGQDRIEVAAEAADVERTLTVGDVEVRLGAGSTAVTDADDVARIRTAMADEPTAGGVLARATERVVGTVPASAVVVDRSGVACFFTSPRGQAVHIDATEGGFGLVDVDEQLIGSPVLVDPRAAGTVLTCG